jgi:hypothetical protein
MWEDVDGDVPAVTDLERSASIFAAAAPQAPADRQGGATVMQNRASARPQSIAIASHALRASV